MISPPSAFGVLAGRAGPQAQPAGAASGPAEPHPRRPLGWTLRRLGWLAALAAGLPLPLLAQSNSTTFTDEQIQAGRVQFQRTCAQCHGHNMVNAGTTVYDLRRFPLDDPDRFQHSVTQGKGNMPSFNGALTPEQISLLWAYVGTRGGKER